MSVQQFLLAFRQLNSPIRQIRKKLPRPPTPDFWITRLWEEQANRPHQSAAALATLFEKEGARIGRDDYPAARTITRLKARFNALDESEKERYREVYWPEVCESGLFPWEAGRAVLELLGYLWPRRPTVLAARAFWRVTLARPDLEIHEKWAATKMLAIFETLPSAIDVRPLEAFLSGASQELPASLMWAVPLGDGAEDTLAVIEAFSGTVLSQENRDLVSQAFHLSSGETESGGRH
jgi:hypothetical protein